VFSALPHGTSADLCRPYLGNTVVIDLSADFRLTDPGRYRRAYGVEQPQPAWQEKAVYGLVEWYRAQLAVTPLIAVPGCYPTATLLPILPLAEAGMITGTVHVAAMSGTSGAGRGAKTNQLLAERAENLTAYNPGRRHRHAQEIEEQYLIHARGHRTGRMPDASPSSRNQREEHAPGSPILFTPHLIPMKQGMAVTTTVPVHDPVPAIKAIETRYREENFIELIGESTPDTGMVRGTNRIAIGWYPEERFLILLSTVDNLWKGAAGQAIQCMNVRFGFEETAGLISFGEV
jgi:N-acetyl-gamma-glutamyl-phosphate reductase